MVQPFWLSPPLLSPESGSDVEVVADDGVPGLVLARALLPYASAPVTPPVAAPGVARPARRSRRWAAATLFPYGDAVAAVAALQREDVVWFNGDVRVLPIPSPPSPPPRRSLRILRRRLL